MRINEWKFEKIENESWNRGEGENEMKKGVRKDEEKDRIGGRKEK